MFSKYLLSEWVNIPQKPMTLDCRGPSVCSNGSAGPHLYIQQCILRNISALLVSICLHTLEESQTYSGGLWHSWHFSPHLPLPFLIRPSFPSPINVPIQGRISSGPLHTVYHQLLPAQPQCDSPCPTLLSEVSPVVSGWKCKSFIFQRYKLHL